MSVLINYNLASLTIQVNQGIISLICIQVQYNILCTIAIGLSAGNPQSYTCCQEPNWYLIPIINRVGGLIASTVVLHNHNMQKPTVLIIMGPICIVVIHTSINKSVRCLMKPLQSIYYCANTMEDDRHDIIILGSLNIACDIKAARCCSRLSVSTSLKSNKNQFSPAHLFIHSIMVGQKFNILFLVAGIMLMQLSPVLCRNSRSGSSGSSSSSSTSATTATTAAPVTAAPAPAVDVLCLINFATTLLFTFIPQLVAGIGTCLPCEDAGECITCIALAIEPPPPVPTNCFN